MGKSIPYCTKRAMPVGSPYGTKEKSRPVGLEIPYGVLDKGKERMGKVSRTVVSEVENEISNRKPVRDDMQETRTVLQNIVDITWGGRGDRLGLVRLWSLVRAQAVVRGHGVEADGKQLPPLVGESGILSRTVCCIQSEARTG